MGLLAGREPSPALATGLHNVLGEASVAALFYIASGTMVLTIGGASIPQCGAHRAADRSHPDAGRPKHRVGRLGADRSGNHWAQVTA